jgi:DNA helicase-4
VGDDWQSINRFAGADISLMSDFERTFGSRTVSLLSTSFRCPADICEVSSHFIRKNPVQVDKVVSTTNPRKRNSIACFEAKDEAGSATLIGKHLELLAENLRKTKKKSVSVLIMGRYRSDQPGEFPQWKNQYRDTLNLAWSTIHGSKGLEADYVFVLNMVQKHRGFPSQIEDDPLLQLAMPTAEEFRYAEERRLFYVALTRAKQVVYVYTQSGRRSEFLVELQKDGLIEIRTGQGGDGARPCPECQRGVLVLRDGKYGEFFGCNRFPKCNYSTNTQDLSPALVGDAAVAGFQYHQGEEVWSTLKVGSQLELVREAANPHDGDAVALYFQGKKLGYMPRGVNSAVAESLDRNEKLIAKVSALSKSGDPYNRVRFSVFHG